VIYACSSDAVAKDLGERDTRCLGRVLSNFVDNNRPFLGGYIDVRFLRCDTANMVRQIYVAMLYP
jgi:hypothetical protein